MDGRQANFEALLAPTLDVIYGTALRMTGTRQEAEGLIQETALLAFNGFDTFQTGTNFKAWFFRFMIERFRSRHRQTRREPQTAPLDDMPDLYLYVEAQNAGLQAQNVHPAARVIHKMSEKQIEEAIATLPEDFQTVALLYFMEDASYQEIADILDYPVEAVRVRLHRSRRLLQKALWQVAQKHGVIAALRAQESETLH